MTLTYCKLIQRNTVNKNELNYRDGRRGDCDILTWQRKRGHGYQITNGITCLHDKKEEKEEEKEDN